MLIFSKSLRRLLPATLLLAAATQSACSGDSLHNRDDTGRPKVSPACDPTFGYHGTEWRRWPGAAPDPFCAPAPLFSQSAPIMTPFDPNMRQWPTFNGGVHIMTPLPQPFVRQDPGNASPQEVPMVPEPDSLSTQPFDPASPATTAPGGNSIPETLPNQNTPAPSSAPIPIPDASFGASAADSTAALPTQTPAPAATPTSTVAPAAPNLSPQNAIPFQPGGTIPEVLPEPQSSGMIFLQPGIPGATPQQRAMQDMAMQQAVIQHQILQRQAMEQILMQQEIATRNMLMERAALQGSVVQQPITTAPNAQSWTMPAAPFQAPASTTLSSGLISPGVQRGTQDQPASLLQQLVQAAASGQNQLPRSSAQQTTSPNSDHTGLSPFSTAPGMTTPQQFLHPASGNGVTPVQTPRLVVPQFHQSAYTGESDTAAPLIRASASEPVGGYAAQGITARSRSIAGLRMPENTQSGEKQPRVIRNQRIQ